MKKELKNYVIGKANDNLWYWDYKDTDYFPNTAKGEGYKTKKECIAALEQKMKFCGY